MTYARNYHELHSNVIDENLRPLFVNESEDLCMDYSEGINQELKSFNGQEIDEYECVWC
jgi:hypothetical protein